MLHHSHDLAQILCWAVNRNRMKIGFCLGWCCALTLNTLWLVFFVF